MTTSSSEHLPAPTYDFNASVFFLHCLDPGRADFTFQTFCDDKHRKDRTLARTLHGSFEDRKDALVELNERGAGVFVTINATNGRRRSENIAYTRGIWHEDDVGLDRIFPVMPSLVVETSPGKYHRHWFAQGLTVDEHAGIMATMVKVHGSDHRATDIVRVLRLPGFYHRKADPFPVRIIGGASKLLSWPVSFPRDKILAAFPPAHRQTLTIKPALPRDDFDRPKAFQALSYISAADRDVWLKVGMALHAETGGSFEAYELWEAWSKNAPDAFDSTDQERVWASFKNEGEKRVTAGTLYYLAAHKGWKPPAEDPGAGFTPVADAHTPPDTTSTVGGKLISRRASEIIPERLEWLWPNRFPRGKCTLLAGHGGLGKTTMLLYMAARITRGDSWPCDEGHAQLGSVIYLSAEDDAADTIVPRLMATGADLARVHIVSAVRRDDGAGRRSFNLQADLTKLEELIEQIGDVRAVIFDPISSYFGRTDTYRNTEVRAVLEPVGEMAARHRITIIGNTHLAKGATGRANHRVLDSVAMTAQARAVLMVLEDPNDNEHRLFMSTKNNLSRTSSGLRFSLADRVVDVEKNIRGSYVVWGDRLDNVTAEEIMATLDAKKAAPTAMEQTASWLREFLASGPKHMKEVEEASRAHGFAAVTLRRAREFLNIKPRKDGLQGPWIWELPPIQLPRT